MFGSWRGAFVITNNCSPPVRTICVDGKALARRCWMSRRRGAVETESFVSGSLCAPLWAYAWQQSPFSADLFQSSRSSRFWRVQSARTSQSSSYSLRTFALGLRSVPHGLLPIFRGWFRWKRLVAHWFKGASFPVCECYPRAIYSTVPLRRDRLRPVAAYPAAEALDDPLQLSKNILCFSNMRRLPSSASSSDSAISDRWPVSSACLTIARWAAIWTTNSAICRLACARYF
jgi:hypothetical protein